MLSMLHNPHLFAAWLPNTISHLEKKPAAYPHFWWLKPVIIFLTSTPNRKVHKRLSVEGYSEPLYSRLTIHSNDICTMENNGLMLVHWIAGAPFERKRDKGMGRYRLLGDELERSRISPRLKSREKISFIIWSTWAAEALKLAENSRRSQYWSRINQQQIFLIRIIGVDGNDPSHCPSH